MIQRVLHTIAITVVAVAAYYGLRHLPDTRCDFLHYELNAVTDAGVEFCETGPAGFLDMERLRYPLVLELTAASRLQIGQAVPMTLRVLQSGGTPLLPHELAVTHTRRLHLLVVDSSLGDYQHIHPEPLGADGEWSWTFTPRKAGQYRVYAEMVPVRTRRKVVAVGTIDVPGVAEVPRIDERLRAVANGYIFELELGPSPFEVWHDFRMTLKVRSMTPGRQVVMQPVMGAYAHMVAFDAEGRGFAHMHPMSTDTQLDRMQPQVGFTFHTGRTGLYRFWAQVRLDDREVFVPFDLQVRDSAF